MTTINIGDWVVITRNSKAPRRFQRTRDIGKVIKLTNGGRHVVVDDADGESTNTVLIDFVRHATKKEIIEEEKIRNKLELHYFSFGMGHVYAGHVQPILAKSEEHAHIVMFRLHGNKWAFHYTEQEWNAAKERGAAREIHLDLIDARKVVLNDYVR